MSPRAGMTLVELLVGLVITALIATILSSSLAQLFDRARRLERAREAVEIDLAAASGFRRVIERAVMTPATPADAQSAPSFLLTAETLYWTAAEPGYPGSAGLYAYGLEIVRNAGAWSIILLRAPLPVDHPAGPTLDEVLAASEPAQIWTGAEKPSFMAFDSAAGRWTGEWEEATPPRLAALVLPGLPIAVARLPRSAQAAPDQPGDGDGPGVGRIERGAEETP